MDEFLAMLADIFGGIWDMLPSFDTMADAVEAAPPWVWRVVGGLIVFVIIRRVLSAIPWKVVAIGLAIILVMIEFGDKFQN